MHSIKYMKITVLQLICRNNTLFDTLIPYWGRTEFNNVSKETKKKLTEKYSKDERNLAQSGYIIYIYTCMLLFFHFSYVFSAHIFNIKHFW